jgi:hypothetical protein
MMARPGERTNRNPKSSLYKRLTRIFSGPLTNYRRQTPRREKRRQLDKYYFQSATGQQFKKASYDPFENLTSNILANQNRVERYGDFDQMEYEPIIASAIDIYADEMSTSNAFNKVLSINCPNEELKAILQHLYDDILNIEFNLFGWCRAMCKFGDHFLYMDIDEKEGISNVISLPASEIERLEGLDKTNPSYVQFQWNSGGLTFENWQIAHFRVLGNNKYVPYGTSVLEASRRIFRQLNLLEDAVMAYRIVRSPERRVFYIDVGAVQPDDVEQYMQKVMTQMKRNQVVDANTGRVDLRYNPMSIEEDYFIPVRGDVSSKVETLAGGTYTGDIDDIKYLKDKLFAALKIPQSYLFRGDGADEDKTTLSQKDVRFSRTIQRLQRAVVAELEKMGIIHLYTLGYRHEDLLSFSLQLNNPSKIAEMQELEHLSQKFTVASAATEGYFSKRWIAQNIFNVSHEEFLRNQREMFHDRKFESLLQSETEISVDASSGGLGGDLGGGLGGDLGADLGADLGGGPDTGASETEAPEPEPDQPDEDSPLLAAPGNRPDKVVVRGPDGKKLTSTRSSHGKAYSPKGSRDRRSSSAPRVKNMRSLGGKTPTTIDTILPGTTDMAQLTKGISEGHETSYDDGESKILKTNFEVKKLIRELEEKKN